MTTRLDKFFTDQGLRPMGTLAHFGIKGMKWGVRRSDAQLAKATSEAADAARARTTQEAISKAKSTSVVSDADLNQLVNRLNLEKRYVEIKASTSVPAKTHSKIKTLLSAGDTMNKAITFSQSPAGKLIAAKLGFSKGASGISKAVSDAASELKKNT